MLYIFFSLLLFCLAFILYYFGCVKHKTYRWFAMTADPLKSNFVEFRWYCNKYSFLCFKRNKSAFLREQSGFGVVLGEWQPFDDQFNQIYTHFGIHIHRSTTVSNYLSYVGIFFSFFRYFGWQQIAVHNARHDTTHSLGFCCIHEIDFDYMTARPEWESLVNVSNVCHNLNTINIVANQRMDFYSVVDVSDSS